MRALLCKRSLHGFVARISAIRSVGGFFEENVTEDLATSILLQSNGWKIVYVDTSDIWYGRSPETVSAYIKQQGRWSLGGFESLSLMLSSNLSLSAFFDYFSGWLYWLWVGPVRLFSLITLVLFLDFRLYTILVNPIFFIIFYFPFFIYSMIFYRDHRHSLPERISSCNAFWSNGKRSLSF